MTSKNNGSVTVQFLYKHLTISMCTTCIVAKTLANKHIFSLSARESDHGKNLPKKQEKIENSQPFSNRTGVTYRWTESYFAMHHMVQMQTKTYIVPIYTMEMKLPYCISEKNVTTTCHYNFHLREPILTIFGGIIIEKVNN